jgi:hypothetical protein
MEKIKAYRHDLCPSDPAHGIRGYECENGWFVEFNDNMPHWDGFATIWYDGKCRTAITGDDYRRLMNKLELIEKGEKNDSRN